MDRDAVDAALAEVRAHLVDTLATVRGEAGAARSGTRVDGSHRPENRGERAAVTTQGYLTGALSGRVAELEEQLRLLDGLAPGPRDRVAPGALVTVTDEDDTTTVFLVAPGGGGRSLDAIPGAVALSPEAPMVRGLLGAREGDVEAVALGTREAELEVVRVV